VVDVLFGWVRVHFSNIHINRIIYIMLPIRSRAALARALVGLLAICWSFFYDILFDENITKWFVVEVCPGGWGVGCLIH
jgi:hypothetical protein